MELKSNKISTYHMYDESLLFWKHNEREYCLRVDQVTDDTNMDPRDMDHESIMFCTHPHYSLGDNLPEKTPAAFWVRILSDYVPESAIAKMLRDDSKSMELHSQSDEWGPWDGQSDAKLKEEFLEYVDQTENFKSAAVISEDYVIILPLWLYDHSGITISCGARCYPYNDKWDSSAIGWIAIDKNHMLSLPDVDETNWKQKAEQLLTDEVKTYDQYITGDVYGYSLISRDEYKSAENTSSPDDPEWEEEDSCYGFYGSDILENGICESVGNGLKEAILNNKTTSGHIEKKVVTYLTYVKEEKNHG